MATQTIEQYLFEQLEKIAPGRYTLASALQLFKSRLRFPCTHLKGGRHKAPYAKDYNLSIFRFPDGITEIKCLYNCGLKVRSDQKDLADAFRDLKDLPTTNSIAASEIGPKRDPGPAPVYSDEYRKRLRESNDTLIEAIMKGLENGLIKPGHSILGGTKKHPDPVEAPESIVERGIKLAHFRNKNKPSVWKATAVYQDSIPALKPKKIRRKTQSRRKRGK